MNATNEIQNNIDQLKANGWTEQQINNIFGSLSGFDPVNFKTNFNRLIYFFSLLPANDTAGNLADLVVIDTVFTPNEYKNILGIINEFSEL